ncbi:MAG: single-stranded DNA-binding protein [Catalinimonas sp.]
MATGVNKVILVGNLGGDPEVRYLEGGTVVSRARLATTETFRDRRGESVAHTEWHQLELWDGLAEVAEQHLKKGDLIYVEGKLRTDQWMDREGRSRTSVRVRVTTLNMLGRSARREGAAPPAAPERVEAPVPAAMAAAPEAEDELPF